MDTPSRFVAKMELYTSIASHRRNVFDKKRTQFTDFVTGQNLNNRGITVENENEFSHRINDQSSEHILIQNKQVIPSENSDDLTTDHCKRFSKPGRNKIIQVSKDFDGSHCLQIAANLVSKSDDRSTSHFAYSHAFNGKFPWHTDKGSDSFSGQQRHVACEQTSKENIYSRYQDTTMYDFVQKKSNKEISLNRCNSCANLTEELIKARRKLKESKRLHSEKEYEAMQLRDTLERNENAIIMSFQDVKSSNNLKTSLIKQNFDSCLKAHVNHSIRNDDTLRHQIAILTEETTQLKERVVALKLQRDDFATRCSRAERQLTKSRDRERELCRDMNQCKIDTIHCSDSMNSPCRYFPERQWKSEDNMKSFDCIDIDPRSSLNFEMSDDFSKLTKSKAAMSDTILLLKDELMKTKKELDRNRKEFEIEKNRWEEEKIKVLNYQRFLQMNYLQLMNSKRGAQECNMEDGSFYHKLSVILEEDSK